MPGRDWLRTLRTLEKKISWLLNNERVFLTSLVSRSTDWGAGGFNVCWGQTSCWRRMPLDVASHWRGSKSCLFYKDTSALRVLPSGPNHLSNSANLSPWELGYQQTMQGRGMRGVHAFPLWQEPWKITQWRLRMGNAEREGTKKKDQKTGGGLSSSSVCTRVALESSSHSLYMNDPFHILFLKYVSFTKIFLASKMYLLWILQEILTIINNYFKGSV